jgi:hypothetical protein
MSGFLDLNYKPRSIYQNEFLTHENEWSMHALAMDGRRTGKLETWALLY